MKTIFDFFKSLPFQVRVITISILGCILILLLTVFQINSCRSQKAKKDDQKRQQVIEQTKGKIEVTEDEKKEQEQKTNEAKKELEQSNSNFNRIISIDSSKSNANFSTAKRKFCEQFPSDSKCR